MGIKGENENIGVADTCLHHYKATSVFYASIWIFERAKLLFKSVIIGRNFVPTQINKTQNQTLRRKRKTENSLNLHRRLEYKLGVIYKTGILLRHRSFPSMNEVQSHS